MLQVQLVTLRMELVRQGEDFLVLLLGASLQRFYCIAQVPDQLGVGRERLHVPVICLSIWSRDVLLEKIFRTHSLVHSREQLLHLVLTDVCE